jgi:NADPH:quinone reductase
MTETSTLPATMRAVIVPTPGGPEALQIVERPVPRPRHGEVLIKVAAAGLNGADLSQRRGLYAMPPGASDVLGLEVSGTVAAIGEGAHTWQVGDAVCALVVDGGYADYCIAPAPQCLPVPTGIDVVHAAGLPEVAFTVWSNVFEIGALRPGERLLVHGGASGIGTPAIKLAPRWDTVEIATAGTDDKCRRCVDLGAARAVNYKAEDFVAAVRDWTDGAGVDLVLDMIGGDYVQRNVECLAPGGRLVLLALKQGGKVEIDLRPVQGKNLWITGSRLRPRPIFEKRRLANAVRKAVWPLIASGDVKPVIDSTFPLDAVQDAHRRLESGEHVGKVLLTM